MRDPSPRQPTKLDQKDPGAGRDLARVLGVTTRELAAARLAESAASVSAVGVDTSTRRQHVARVLGVTVEELKLLRKVFNGNIRANNGNVVGLIRQVAEMAPSVAPSTTQNAGRSIPEKRPSDKSVGGRPAQAPPKQGKQGRERVLTDLARVRDAVEKVNDERRAAARAELLRRTRAGGGPGGSRQGAP